MQLPFTAAAWGLLLQEPITLLQKQAEIMEYRDLLTRADKCEDPWMRCADLRRLPGSPGRGGEAPSPPCPPGGRNAPAQQAGEAGSLPCTAAQAAALPPGGFHRRRATGRGCAQVCPGHRLPGVALRRQ